VAGLRDKLIATGQTADEWANAKPARGKSLATLRTKTITGKQLTLPAPHNRKVPGIVERDVMQAVKHWLQHRAQWFTRIEAGGVIQHTGPGTAIQRPSTMVGIPDWLALIGGRLWGIEVKQPGGKLGPAQAAQMAAMARAGAATLVVTSVDGLERAYACQQQWVGQVPPGGFPVWVF
jgi:hypothetical protein